MATYRATAYLEEDGWRVTVEDIGSFWARDLVSARTLATYLITRTQGDLTPEVDIAPSVDPAP